MPGATETRLISASDLKRQRGWTEGLNGALLSAPDALAPNPYGFRAPMRFFAADRVLEAERDGAFSRWAAQLDERRRWRREQPTRILPASDIEHLEWLVHPGHIALFLAPRVPRRRRRRPPATEPDADTGTAVRRDPPLRFEVLTLF
ncbi:MAG: hypothetical protein JWM31_478 [Solirubrobacterales bacterium]|nr:hypothetical protein [Solirubrobacterales bacterium]